MDLNSEILNKLNSLSQEQQQEILAFIKNYAEKNFEYQSIEQEWNNFSMQQALAELKNDPDLYSLQDIKNIAANWIKI
ncbi:MAG: hypothetical protein LW817_07170 [Candidatus Caenarcaniphilales bacterium]|jgi:hypothetical protein|nr:hypothetical protein [Candidatus Caenarcaniphilales bacterium]